MPLPSCLVEKNGSKIWGKSPSAMPCPVDAEVPDGLAKLLGVHARGQGVAELAHHLELCRMGSVLDEHQNLLEELGEVHGVGGHGGGPRILEEVADDVIEPIGLSQHDLDQAVTAAVRRQLAREGLDGPGQRGEGITDLVGDVRGEPTDRGQAVCLAHPLLHALDGGEILADADEPDHLALSRPQRPEGDADRHLEAVAPFQADLVAQRLRSGTGHGQPYLVEVDPPAEDRFPCLAQRFSLRHARDGFGRAVEGRYPADGIDGDQPRAHRLEDQVAKGLKVGEFPALVFEAALDAVIALGG